MGCEKSKKDKLDERRFLRAKALIGIDAKGKDDGIIQR
jgi:hypothetical protein